MRILSTSLDLRFHLFPQPMCHQQSQRRIVGILFRTVSRQTATITTRCSIGPHKNPRILHKHISLFLFLVHPRPFSSFTVQSQATQLTTLCTDERGYMSNTSSLLFSLLVIFVLDRLGGGGSDVCVWVFLKGHALMYSSKWESHDFFRIKNFKIPRPTSPPPRK